MAQIKVLKIGVDGVPTEHTGASDDLTLSTLTLGTALTVANGGTSLATLTANNVILGNGTSAPLFVAPGTSGNVLTSNGTTWTSAANTASSAQFIDSSWTAASGGIAIRDVVSTNANADEVQKADANSDSSSRIVGLAVAAASGAAAVSIRSKGLMSGFSAMTVNTAQFLSETAGGIVETLPTTSGANIVRVGYAKSTTVLDIGIEHLGRRA